VVLASLTKQNEQRPVYGDEVAAAEAFTLALARYPIHLFKTAFDGADLSLSR
jgi:hypothetical protein